MMKNFKKVISLFLIFTVAFFINTSISEAITSSANPEYSGIDVSNWQGYINYSEVKSKGIEVVYIKASEGTRFKDPYFEYNYENAKANGLKVGFYHFVTATNETQAREQAQFFASVISGKAPDCKLAMDFEQFNGISTEEVNKISRVFLETVENLTGKQTVIYSNLYDTQRVFNSELASRYPLWLAYYGDYNKLVNVSSSWSTWDGVQYTSRGTVAGINGYVDRNRFTKNIFLEECTSCPEVENPNPDLDQNSKIIYYTVRRGDTLSAIALKYGTTVQEIVNLNDISNPDLIYPGQVFKILTDSNNNYEETNEMGYVVYTVKRNDNLWNISRRYGVTIQSIVDTNNIRNPRLIYPGQKIRIPYRNNITQQQSYSYIVIRGDTLWGIARRYGVSVKYLVYKNNIRNPRLIYPGQVIKI